MQRQRKTMDRIIFDDIPLRFTHYTNFLVLGFNKQIQRRSLLLKYS